MRRFRLLRKSTAPQAAVVELDRDKLTSLLLPGEWWRADPEWWRPGSLVALLNVDRMIHFNAARGHLMGDHALRVIGSLMAISSDEAGSRAEVFRIGGNEFAVVWQDATPEAVGNAMERLRASVETTGLGLTVRIAVSIIREGESPQRVLTRLDGFMHESAIAKANSVYIDSELSLSTLTVRDALLSRLCGALWPEGPLLDALALSPALDILDVGAGDGRLLKLLQARGHIGRLEGLDPTGGEGIRNGMAHALPYSDASLDVVLFVRALAHMGWPEAALREARRVLRPGGRLVVAAQGPEHLRETWRALGQTDSPPAPEVMDDTLDIRLAVTVTAQDARALAQSYGKEGAVEDAHFPMRDAVHLQITVQTT